jgi:hypothetical protein
LIEAADFLSALLAEAKNNSPDTGRNKDWFALISTKPLPSEERTMLASNYWRAFLNLVRF